MIPVLAAAAIAWQLQQPPAQHGVADAGDAFESIGIRWSSDAIVSVRVSADGKQWSPWTALDVDRDLSDPSESRYLSAITHFGAAKRYVEYSFTNSPGAITFAFFPPQKRRVVEESTGVRLRTDWGCPDGESSRWTPEYTVVTHAVVHHTAGANDVPDWEAEVRGIWYYHTFTNKWGDIGYNFLIDPNGVVYEGRAGGHGVKGAHFSCRNANTVGIALLGTFTNVAPTAAALQSLEHLLAAICDEDQIDPHAVRLHPSSGLNLPTILGHRDGNVPGATCTTTECPGDVLYSMLPAIRSDVATMLDVPKVRRRAVLP